MAAATLIPAQARAVAHPGARLQIVACAGSGKTEVLARRAVRLLGESADPASVIAFTFTEKAAAELKARIETRAAEADRRFRELPPVGRGMFIGTTHAWALRALQELGGSYETVDALTEEQEWALLHRVARRVGIADLYAEHVGRQTSRIAIPQAIGVFLRSAEVVHDERIGREVLRAAAPRFAAVLDRYEWLLGQMRLLPFRLMLARAVDELAPRGRLEQRLRGRVTHVLVDEYQDFNRGQDRLLAALAGLGATATVVGDDDQAIYQWRGGEVELFRSFPRRFPGTHLAELETNHRCRPEIVRFAKPLVASLAGRIPKALRAAREPAASGAVEVVVGDSAGHEAQTIADRIGRLLAQGHQPSDIAVLYRSVRTSAPPLVEEIRRRRIPFAVIGKTSLLARPEMALIARILVWWAGGVWYPNPEFAPETVTPERLLDLIGSVTGMHAEAARDALRRLERLGDQVRREAPADSVALFNELLVVLGLPGHDDGARWREIGLGRLSELLTEFDHVIRRATPAELYATVSPAQADEAAEDMVMAADREDRPETVLGATRGEVYLMRLRAFLEEFAGRAAEETPDTAPEARNAVQIMTIHQAKGLEFPVVFVPALVEGRFPSRMMGREQQWYLPDDLFDRARYQGREDDEARLLYVALTRARELLVVSWFANHHATRAVPSRFITGGLRGSLRHALQLGRTRPPVLVGSPHDELLDLDFSSLVTYFECGYRYWLRHVCGFQPPLVPELGFGKLLHHTVAELARLAIQGHRPSDADVNQILERSFYLPFAGPVPATRLREAARRRTTAYARNYGEELTRAIAPEARFEVPLANARIRGRIDLLLRARDGSSDQVELVDFKTSANRPPDPIHINQLRMYAVAAERLGLEPVRLAIHDLDADNGGRIEVPYDNRQREAFQHQLESWVEGIRRGTFTPVDDRATCRGCDFRRFCQHAPEEARRWRVPQLT